jgi:WD40 repeat protein
MVLMQGYLQPLIIFLLFAAQVQGQWVHNGSITYSNDVWEVNFSPDGQYVVVASNDQNHCIITVETRSMDYCFPSAPSPAFTAKFSPNHQYVAFGFQDGTVRIMTATSHPSYPLAKNLNVPFGQVQEVHFNA